MPEQNGALEIRKVTGGEFAKQFGLTPPPGSPEFLEKIRSMGAAAAPANDDALHAAGTFVPGAPPQTVQPSAAPSATKRVFIVCGRGTDFVVSVEDAPDWDTVWQGKFDGPSLLKMLDVLHALGVKVKDSTGGELADLRLEMEHGRTRTSRPKAKPAHGEVQPPRSRAGRASEDLEAGIGAEIDALGGADGEWTGAAR